MSARSAALASQAGSSGALGLTLVRGDGQVADLRPQAPLGGRPALRDYVRAFSPSRKLDEVVNEYRIRNLANVQRGFRRVALARRLGIPTLYGQLWLKVARANGTEEDLGLVSLQVVTSAGVNYLAADMAAGASDINLFKFHGFGSGTNAESSSDTALQTEFTTEYATDSTRPTGSQNASTNTYTTVATFSPDANAAVTEHGILTQAATGGGTLWDRSKFSVVNLVGSADSLQATYVATFAAGG